MSNNSIFIEDAQYLQAFLNETTWRKWYYQDFFPLSFNPTLDWKVLYGEGVATVAANVIPYGTPAPEKTRRTLKKLTGQIPKSAMMRTKDEPDLNDYWDLIGRQNTPPEAIMDFIFDDVSFCFDGVHARREAMALEALSTFELTLTTTTNDAGVIIPTKIEYQLPANNKRAIKGVGTRIWSNATTSNYKPVEDFWDIIEAAQDAGKPTPKYAVMNLTNWRQFRKADDVIDIAQPFTYNQGKYASLEAVNLGFGQEGLPKVVVVDPQISHESKEHVLTSTNPWTDNYVTFLPDLSIGKMLYGPNAEERSDMTPQAIKATRDGVLITKYSEVNPIREFTTGQSNCIPVIPNVLNCFRLHVTVTSATTGIEA